MSRRADRGTHKRGATSPRSLHVSDGFRSFVLDQLEPLGSIVAKAMFGGVGLYCDGTFFGLIARDVLYLKVDDTNRGDFERAGSEPFRPYPDRAGTMQYYAVPLGVLESQSDLEAWARTSVNVAIASGHSRPTAAASRSVSDPPGHDRPSERRKQSAR